MDPAANDIPGFLDRVELTFEEVTMLTSELPMSVTCTSKSARGLLYDAEVVHKCCIATEKESRSISSQMRGFSIMEFAQKLKASVGCEESGLTPSGLKLLWAKVCSLIWVTPKAKYLYGTFEKGLPPPKPKRVVKNASRTNDGPVVIPDISKHLEKQEDTGTVAQVNNVHRCIMREYKENGCQPILYWKIILNPESFTKSIENMSHLAFLTQDKSLRMSLGMEKGKKKHLMA
ncbi:unnamed protein product [Darwinula stevensoni]|uniref:Non-structural maintenance of chromosomes element 4 n=1 Tax=Darwinula stevensoni TaxID=69355 RepID=A0A7R8XE22_9CRUS|nr:unnamed protein product [Darwinula stevensoni]CAG0893615.1 unnamed protein product [Darwinula stevensoni]